MPSREIRRKFTKSDIAIMSWRSAEVSANMHNKTVRPASLPAKLDSGASYMENTDRDAELQRIEERLGGIVYRMTDDKGEIDLRKLTGDEACQYMAALGIPIIRM